MTTPPIFFPSGGGAVLAYTHTHTRHMFPFNHHSVVSFFPSMEVKVAFQNLPIVSFQSGGLAVDMLGFAPTSRFAAGTETSVRCLPQ